MCYTEYTEKYLEIVRIGRKPLSLCRVKRGLSAAPDKLERVECPRKGKGKMRLEIFKPFLPLLQEKKEWGGYIHTLSGEVDGPREGKESSFPFGSAEEERAKREAGWVTFHTHPNVPEPSAQDVLVAHLRGGPEYVITTRGIWEVKPVRVLPVEEICRLNEEAWAKAQDLEIRWGDEAYWFWKENLRQILPAEISLLAD